MIGNGLGCPPSQAKLNKVQVFPEERIIALTFAVRAAAPHDKSEFLKRRSSYDDSKTVMVAKRAVDSEGAECEFQSPTYLVLLLD